MNTRAKMSLQKELGSNMILQEEIKELKENAVGVEKVHRIEKIARNPLKLLLAYHVNEVEQIVSKLENKKKHAYASTLH